MDTAAYFIIPGAKIASKYKALKSVPWVVSLVESNGGIIPFAKKVLVADRKTSNELGELGEVAVRSLGLIGNNKKKEIFINGRKRIPDDWTIAGIAEVKNVAKLSFTRQLRDYAKYAKDEGMAFTIYIRKPTPPKTVEDIISGPLLKAWKDDKLLKIEPIEMPH